MAFDIIPDILEQLAVFVLGCARTFTVSNKPHFFFELLRGTKLQGDAATLLQ